MNITESIKALAISYIAKFDVVDDIEGINEGFCGYFAEDIAKQIDGAVAIWDTKKFIQQLSYSPTIIVLSYLKKDIMIPNHQKA